MGATVYEVGEFGGDTVRETVEALLAHWWEDATGEAAVVLDEGIAFATMLSGNPECSPLYMTGLVYVVFSDGDQECWRVTYWLKDGEYDRSEVELVSTGWSLAVPVG